MYETSCCSKASLAFGFVFWILSPLIDVLLLFSCSVMSDYCDPMDSSIPAFPVFHYLPEFAHSRPLNRWCHPTISSCQLTDLIFLSSKITVDDDYSHEIKRQLLLRRKAMTNLDSILKSKDITLPTKVHIIKPMVFPVVMHGCERWTIKNTDAEELMFLNCGVREDSWESLGLQGDQTCQS